jgi:hypothetical protein
MQNELVIMLYHNQGNFSNMLKITCIEKHFEDEINAKFKNKKGLEVRWVEVST